MTNFYAEILGRGGKCRPPTPPAQARVTCDRRQASGAAANTSQGHPASVWMHHKQPSASAGFLAGAGSSTRRLVPLWHTPQRTPLANAPLASHHAPAHQAEAGLEGRAGTGRRLNASQIRWLYPFPPHRFHVLFNSLFKVLCNFPSRYLFAIGFVVVFSLR
jgi:hypothetical protein